MYCLNFRINIMNAEHIYNQWLQSKHLHTKPHDFVNTVLNRINPPRLKKKKNPISSEDILEWFSTNLSLKTGAVAVGGFGGALRIGALIYFLLFA
jgi:hypothetical protein